jgi:hypothetical protein
MSIYKNGNASTLQIVQGVKNIVVQAAQSLPPELKITSLFDQSLFVRASIEGVLREGLIAAALTAVMILIFLGDWRPDHRYLHFHSALHLCLDHPSGRDRTDHQHHDVGRAGAGRRHPGR